MSLVLASKKLVVSASRPTDLTRRCIKFDCSLMPVRWISQSADPRKVPIRKLPKIELEPGERMLYPNPKKLYIRTYKSLIVNTDGSSYYAEVPMPYPITFIPLDLSKLSEEELEKRRLAHLPPKKEDEGSDEGFSDEEMKVKDDYKHLV